MRQRTRFTLYLSVYNVTSYPLTPCSERYGATGLVLQWLSFGRRFVGGVLRSQPSCS